VDDSDPKVVRYCKEICKASCCYCHDPYEPAPVRCPRLNSDNSCSVYRERYSGPMADVPVVSIGTFRSKVFKDLTGTPTLRPFFCGHIERLLQGGHVRPEVAEKCVYAHPELLSRVDEL
jgi:hypothetical protein